MQLYHPSSASIYLILNEDYYLPSQRLTCFFCNFLSYHVGIPFVSLMLSFRITKVIRNKIATSTV